VTPEEKKIISDRCPRCVYGYWDGKKIFCSHWYHAGYVLGSGTEWVATCCQFEDTGKVGRIVHVMERREVFKRDG
jgi:hypothetical protein